MIPQPEFGNIFLCSDFVDFRKSINGLAAIVESELGLSPFQSSLFIFCNRHRDKIKALYWNRTGFCLWYMRLEKDKFIWPEVSHNGVMELTAKEIAFLFDGFDIRKVSPHQTLNYSKIS